MEDSAKITRLDEDLSRRLHHALTTEKEGLFRIMEDPSSDVLQAALKNPLLGENHLAVMLKRRDLTEDIFSKVYKWNSIAAVPGNAMVGVPYSYQRRITNPFLPFCSSQQSKGALFFLISANAWRSGRTRTPPPVSQSR